jgi:hypothetical protein
MTTVHDTEANAHATGCAASSGGRPRLAHKANNESMLVESGCVGFARRWATGERSGPRDGSENSSSADRGLLGVEKVIASQQNESFGAVCMVG